jgi:hypothetical protein
VRGGQPSTTHCTSSADRVLEVEHRGVGAVNTRSPGAIAAPASSKVAITSSKSRADPARDDSVELVAALHAFARRGEPFLICDVGTTHEAHDALGDIAVSAIAMPHLARLVARVRGRERPVSARWAFGDGD